MERPKSHLISSESIRESWIKFELRTCQMVGKKRAFFVFSR